jgi:thymidylate synthase (FAD)
MAMLREGATPQQARSVLPNSLKTEIVVSTNIREWRHIFGLRCVKEAHPQMRQVMIPLLLFCKEQMPTLFDDIKYDKDFNPDNYAELYIDYSFERA